MSSWNFVALFYGFEIITAIVLILLGVFIYDKRFRKNHGEIVPKGFEKTDEVTIDPVNGEKTRVYYNPETGERFYKKEN